MSASLEFNSLVPMPRLERAKKLVPPRFYAGYEWFMSHEEKEIDRLPFGSGRPSEVDYPLARQAGIHSPAMSYPGKRYVISVHSSDLKRYPDKEPIVLANGTWIIDYQAQDNNPTKTNQDYNGWLMNCLADGIPIGVMTRQPKSGIKVRGLAYVESYNPISKSFILHGPVNAETERAGYFDAFNVAELSPTDRETLSSGDELEKRRLTVRVQREQQDRFRRELLDAYDGRCAITGTDVPEVLQAAHIEPYRGIATQRVENGLLLRADIHLLYDSRLLTVKPDGYTVDLNNRLCTTIYEDLRNVRINLPRTQELHPDLRGLNNQYKLFQIEQLMIA